MMYCPTRTVRVFFLLLPLVILQAHAVPRYTVTRGDSLYRIAKKFDTSVEELKRLNNLTGSVIQPGDRLVVAAAETRSVESATEDVLTRDAKTYHTVYRGDTFYGIARKYGTTVSELKRLNPSAGDVLRPGQRILAKVVRTEIPIVRQAVPEPAREEKPEPAALNLLRNLAEGDAATKVLESALSFLGTPYRLGGSSRSGIDCSGLVRKSFDAVGIDMPRTARTQCALGEYVALTEVIPGDLIFFTRTTGKYPSHVAIYLGEGMILHASSGKHKVVVESLNKSVYRSRYNLQARRILPEASISLPEAEGPGS